MTTPDPDAEPRRPHEPDHQDIQAYAAKHGLVLIPAADLPSPAMLEILAAWFDARDAIRGGGDTEIQDELRRWARQLRAALP